MTYVMTGRLGNTFTIDVSTTIFRDAIQLDIDGVPDFDPVPREDFIEVAVYRREGSNWVLVPGPDANSFDNNFYIVQPDAVEEVLRLNGNICFDTALLDRFEAGVSSYTLSGLTLDIINEDYLIVFQRCCRQENLNNIIDSGNTGSVTSILISPEAQAVQNSSPQFINDPDILICAGFEQEINVEAEDMDGDSIVYTYFFPETAGGPKGGAAGGCAALGLSQFCVEDCDGILPSPTNCGPSLFGNVSYQTGFNFDNPISSVSGFTIDQAGIISGTADQVGVYLIGVIAEEFRNGVKIGETKRDFNVTVANCNAVAVIGPPNGNVGQLEIQCSIAPFRVNATQNSCGETNVQVSNYTNQDSMATPFLWRVFDTQDMSLLGTNELNWTPTFSLPVGEYEVEFAIFPDEICRAFCRHTIEVTVDVDADFVVDSPVACSGDPVLITPPSLPTGYTYNWDFGDGRTSTQRDPDPIQYADDGDYIISLVATNGSCIEESDNMANYIAKPADVTVDLSNMNECIGTDISFTNTIPDDYTVSWDFGDGNTSTERNPVHQYDRAGQFTVTLDATAPNNCVASTPTPSITIADAPDADFTVATPATCSGDPINVTGPAAQSGISYSWDFGNGESSTQRNPDPIDYAAEGDYEISLIVDNGICTNNSSQPVSFFLPPDSFVTSPSEFLKCSPAEITFENSISSTSPYRAEWDFGDGNGSTDISPTHLYGNGGTYNVLFRLIAPNGQVCDVRDYSIEIIDGPDADFSFSPNPVLNPNEQVRFTNLTTPINSSFEWDFGDGAHSTEEDPSHVFGVPADYTVRLIARSVQNACVDTAFANVPVSSSGAPEYPNAFSPLNGQNTEFRGVSVFSNFINYRLSVYDRWGQQVFDSMDFDLGWNGKKNNQGNILPQGVYLYHAAYSIDVAGDIMDFQKKGTVLLIN